MFNYITSTKAVWDKRQTTDNISKSKKSEKITKNISVILQDYASSTVCSYVTLWGVIISEHIILLYIAI